jgi:hypothetical protein
MRWHAIASALTALSLLMVTPAVRAAGVSVEQANEAQKEAATGHFDEGMRLYDDEKFEEALAAFRASYEAVASPNSHLQIARSLAKLERPDDAYEEYGKVLDEAEALGKDYAAAADAARVEREDLRRKVALLSVKLDNAPEGTELDINGKTVSAMNMPVPVKPGPLEIVARTPKGLERSKRVTAEAGTVLDVTLGHFDEPEPKPEPKRTVIDPRSRGSKIRRDGAYIAAAIGVGGIATWGVITLVGSESLDDVGTGGLLLGGVGIGAFAVLYLTSEPAPSASAAPDPSPNHRIRVGLAVGPNTIALRGAF